MNDKEMLHNAPIGVFDSGVGGLTVAREIMRQLPNERIVYFGDTARVPYGSKSPETITRYSSQIVRFLQTQQVKAIVIACNSASACALETLEEETNLPIIDVVRPGARTALETTVNGKIGVIATEATICSGIYKRYIEESGKSVSTISKACPLFVPLVISNMAAGNVSIIFGLKGKNINVVTACATGTNSIGEAFRTIQYGDAEVMIAGGTEGSICPIGVGGFSALTALSTSEDPQRCSIPFDKERGGFVMGEGAAVVVLEELEHAKARGAKIYAEVAGYGCSSDAYHITSPAEDGAGAAKAMEYAVADAGLAKEDITYINAHGTGTHHNDLFETRAIKLLFGDHAKNIKINSTKSMVGHLLGAAGAIEFVTCVKEIEEGYIHRTVGYEVPDEELDLNYCKEAYTEDVEYALSNSLGFGGHNASLVVKKYHG